MLSLLKKQKEFFAAGHTRSWLARKHALNRLEKVLVERRDHVMEALAEDLGKPAVEAYLAEYYFLLQELRLIRKNLKRWLKSRRVGSPPYFQPCSSYVRRDPYGVVFIIAPWNYPIQLSLSPLIAAVAAGNTVILKPSEMATASERLLVDIIAAVFDPEHVAVVTGDAATVSDMLECDFDFVFFTGSTQVGKIVAQKSAKQLTPHILELGGKCPCIVDSSADIRVAAKRILAGKFFNGGQTCFAPDFVAVSAEVKDELISAMQELLKAVPWNAEMARIINERHFCRLKKMLPQDCLVFGEDDIEGLRLAPRLVPDAQWDDDCMKEEIFGPILPVVTFKAEDDLLSRLSSYGSPLALYIFSTSRAMQNLLMRVIPSGGVCINDTMKQGSNLNIPFGGVGDSGYGRYRGKTGVEAFSFQRAVVNRPTWAPEMFELMPPYGGKIKMLKKFLR
ncbi:MAG: aldehyde dehydrogenase family protein [Akkermansiaceae bacterium]|nr:aldehyde dehydrogenase family protein [Akkermansiaceae bacterium]